MPRTILLIDVSQLCYRAMYSSHHDLSYRGVKTGVIYGTLRDIMELRMQFGADVTAFCFDSRESKRREMFPEYKSNRLKMGEREPAAEEAWLEMHRQMLDLRLKYLSWAGFRNILIKNGYEADDMAGSVVCHSIQPDDNVIMVTGDKDYYQLLRPNVCMYNVLTKKRMTIQSFYREYGFEYTRWAEYLSICGCGTDTVPGIKGVGPVNAIRYIKGEEHSIPAHMHLAIDSKAGREIRARNMKLVKLPLDGVPVFDLKTDKFNLQGWKKVCEELGAGSLKQYTT